MVGSEAGNHFEKPGMSAGRADLLAPVFVGYGLGGFVDLKFGCPVLA